MFDAHFDAHLRRLSLRYSGFWSEADAAAILERFRTQIAVASRGGTFTLLEDFCDFPVQRPQIMEVGKAFVEIIDRSPISRDAMVVESALLRSQFRRHPGSRVLYEIFPDRRSAESWLIEVEPVS